MSTLLYSQIQALYILTTLAIRFWQMGQPTSFCPHQVQVIKWPQPRKKQSIILSMHSAHLALVLLLQDGALLHPPPSWNPVLESDATQHQDTFDLLVGQLQEQRRAHPSLADRTLSQLLSNLIAGDQVAAVEEDAQSRTTTKMPTKTTPKGRK